MAPTQTIFARMLVRMVFKQEALAICSARGRSANGLGKEFKKEKKPALHQKALNAILGKISKF